MKNGLKYQKVVDEDDDMSQAEAFAKAMQGGGQGPSASSSGTSFEDLKSSQRSDATFDDEESPGAGKSQNPNERIERPEQASKDMDAQARAERYDSIQVSHVTFNSDGSIKEKVFTKVKDLKTTVKHRFEKPDPNDPVASFKSKIPTFWFMKHVQNTELWHQLFLVSKRCYDHSKPRDVAIDGDYRIYAVQHLA